MDIKQIQTFKQIVDSINKNDILNIDTQWEKICFEFNIDTSIYPPQEKNIQYVPKHLSKKHYLTDYIEVEAMRRDLEF